MEVLFSPSNFGHLVGCNEIVDKVETNPTDFYNRIIKNQIDWNNLVIESKFVKNKIDILPQIMAIDRTANIIGDYNGVGQIKLKSDKVTGNIVGCLGISRARENPRYFVPVSTIKRDIRDISYNNERIVAILKKNCLDALYENFTYLKKGFSLDKILNNKDISKCISHEKIFSNNKFINKIIVEYSCNRKNSTC